MKLKLPRSSQNWISLAGVMIALISLFMIVFLFAISMLFDQGGSYLGLIIYILLPAVLILGLILIPVGMVRTKRRVKAGSELPEHNWPKIDLNDIRHRNGFIIFIIGTTFFLFISAIGSYEAFHFTESVEFCGTICHEVMKPEYVAYQHSSHARVACVECHVGAGADWYFRSKLSGLYQVYSVTFNLYPRPIPTPIHNLRPAQETCERCHWPQKFYAQKLRNEQHYLNDDENTPWNIQLKMKIGAEQAAHGLSEGIHWHINPDVRVEYIAADEQNLSIPWVRLTNVKTGEVKTFIDEENIPEDLNTDQSEKRVMDCMDCHNRPSHNYRPPAYFVNDAITAGSIPADLPGIKNLAMEICSEEFTSLDSAKQYIEETMTENYADDDEISEAHIEKAIAGLIEVYAINIFPEMRVRWDKYPSHIGHIEFDGCFRCHNDRHTTEDGQLISKDCNICHTITAQGSPNDMQFAAGREALEFRHPVDIDEEWKELLCTDCHTGLNP